MKKCTICKSEKPVTEFNKKKRNKDGLQNVCRECNQKKSRAYYKKNRKKHIAAVKTNTKKYIEQLKIEIDQLRINGCCICGEKEKICLDWHHLDPSKKDFNVSSAINRYSVNREAIFAEIAKCICVCSNCHRKIHAGIIVL
tara:strand:+ start:171 stop:593 length:423 start_codon:yes stop_codon:yes gene_type:complete